NGAAPGIGDRSAVADDVNDPQVQPGTAAQAERQRGMLAGVDHQPAPADLPDGGVDAQVVPDVLVERRPQRGPQGCHAEQRHAPGAIDPAPQLGDAIHGGLVPSTEGGAADLLPEGARGERPPAPAALASAGTPLPQMDDLAGRADTRQLAQQPL